MIRCPKCGAENVVLERRIVNLERKSAENAALLAEARAITESLTPRARPALALVETAIERSKGREA